MEYITHLLFKLRLPAGFETGHISPIGTILEYRKAIWNSQWPTVSMTLLKLSDLNDETFKGNNWQESFEDSCLSRYFKSEKLNGKRINFQGLDAYTINAHTDAIFQKTHFRIDYRFMAIVLDNEFYLEFTAIREKTVAHDFDAWVHPMLDSLEILGDTANRHAAWQKYEEEQKVAEQEYQQKLTSAAAVNHRIMYEVDIPTDKKEVFTVGDFHFKILREASKMTIGSLSKDLQITIKAQTNEIQKGLKAEILNDYPGDGGVEIVIPAKGVHKNGVPTGSFVYEEGKTNAPLFLNSRIQGFDYRLDFNGTVVLKDGWFLAKGEMTKSYHNKSFPIHIALLFDVSALQWSDYCFTSLEETTTASSNDVRSLVLENPDFALLPEVVFTYKNLEHLTVLNRSNSWEQKVLPLNEIQDEIGQFKKLKTLRINGASITKIPKSIGQLADLEQLSINNCNLKDLPESIFQLPKLKYLWLSSNMLTILPKHINLPQLQNISLDKNQFKTLPESLAKQPKLKIVKLQGNPLEQLPDAFNQIKGVDLEIKDKLRLLDFDYKGADGQGIKEWDDTVFWAKNDIDLVLEITQVIKENKLMEHAVALESMVKKAIGFKHGIEEDYGKVGNHRFGGMPDLPEEILYPRFGENWREDKTDYAYEFIGQINCGDIAHLQEFLPRTGILFFFLETIHSIYGGTNNPGKVIYCRDISKLSSGNRFSFTNDDYSDMINDGYQGFQVSVTKQNSAPSFYASSVNEHLFLGESQTIKDDEQLLDELYDTFEKPINDKKPFQYAVNAYGFTQQEAPELQASLAKKGNPQDWITLLTVTSAGDMQWSDAGDIFFVIHKSDLAKQDFSNVFVTLESS